MKIFKVIDTIKVNELVDYPSKYYDVDGKLCYKVKVFEETIEYKVKAFNEDHIREKVERELEITFIENFENQFSKIAPNDYVKFERSKTINKKFIGFEDAECSEEVQEEYSKDPENFMKKPLTFSDF